MAEDGTPFLWPHKWEDDPRDPLVTFQVFDRLYGFYFFSIPQWIQMLAFIVAETMVAAVVAAFLYQTVVRKGKTGTTNAYLIGYSVFVPFWIFAPKFAVEQLGIDNKIFRFCLCVITPTMSIFRTTEAIHGFAPDYVVKSMADYVLYFASPMYLKYNTKTEKYVKATPRRMLWHLGRFLAFLFMTGMYQSAFTLFPGYFPSLSLELPYGGFGAEWYSWQKMMDPAQWRDNAVYASLMQLYLMAYGEGLVFATTVLTQRQTEPIMDNPMLESKSPSDFWGRRWNLLVHRGLKNGVYKPVRKHGGGKPIAVLATFVASGLFHEWLLPSVFFDYPNTHGTTTFFFAWQAMLVAMEALIGHWTVFQRLSKSLPGAVRTFLVIIAGVPLGHWFIESYISSNFFLQGQVTFPTILPMERYVD
jgi:hypothetical protein